MSYRKIESREYKVMLDPTRFGDPQSLPARASDVWGSLHEQLQDAVSLTSAQPGWTASSPRQVTFWDTPRGSLYRRDFILRSRSDEHDRQVTLKKRTPDRVLAAHNGIDKKQAEEAGFDLRRKFEEDIKLSESGRMSALFSHTLDWRDAPREVDLSTDIVEHAFPGFTRAIDVNGTALRPLGGITLSEYVVEAAEVNLGDKPVEMALIVWYQTTDRPPSAVELSYRYGGDEQHFDPGLAADALLLLHALSQLTAWRSPDDRGSTKTSWLYREAGVLP